MDSLYNREIRLKKIRFFQFFLVNNLATYDSLICFDIANLQEVNSSQKHKYGHMWVWKLFRVSTLLRGLTMIWRWYPCRDSNPGTRFRKPLLCPSELQGRAP
jgi:hypothetical protein